MKKTAGRPELKIGKKTKYLQARLSEQEYHMLVNTAKELNLSQTELIRARVINNNQSLLINAKEAIQTLDKISMELNRAGNNINQIARYTNSLKLMELENMDILPEFNKIFGNYILIQQDLEKALRRIIRQLANP